MERFIHDFRKKNKSVGLVPTMGALHEGHLSLLRRSKSENELTVCSIFVNPTQFNNAADLEKYPRPVEEDIQVLSEQGCCDLLFMPSQEEMYPEGVKVETLISLGNLEQVFEGEFRPGHFQGVAHIVHKLLTIVAPDCLYMGQKDYQQCLVVERMIKEKNLSVNLVVCPIKREEDGLAMSSRNRLLTPTQRTLAGLIYQCLVSIQAQKNQKDFATVQKECIDLLAKKGVQPDYVALADAKNLEPLSEYDPQREMVALIAATIGQTRLIDNLLL